MIIKHGYRTITSYRVLPPKWKIVGPEKDERSPADQYLSKIDQALQDARANMPVTSPDDIASLVFANQAMSHDSTSRQLAELVQERRTLNKKHLRDVQWRLDEMLERKPLRGKGPRFHDDASLTEVERQILNLEWQKRALEVALWKDTNELRTKVVDERRERETTQRRIRYLGGGVDSEVGGDYGGA